MRRSILQICVLLTLLAIWLSDGKVTALSAGASSRTLILAAQDDPYLPLAEEIAHAENLTIVRRADDALAQNPEFLLWVAAPANLTDRVLADFGQAVRAHRTSVSVGVISGSSIEHARALWQRAARAQAVRVFAVNAVFPSAQVFEGRIREARSNEMQPLTKETLVATLQQADYLTFTGHGGAGYLSLTPKTTVIASDIPMLPPVVVGTASCQTFCLWRADSIALAFADQGAAAYAGFVFSPNEGFLLGEFDGLPFRYTWHDFPIGHVMQVQTRGILRGFAAFPYYFLLGDPRIALQEKPPYNLIEDRRVGDSRVLTFADAPAGIVPVRITDGARYRFVEIVGITSASDDDLFYNSRAQTANIGADKYLLFKHTGGDFTVRLYHDTPLLWTILNPPRDALDDALIFLQPNGGALFSLGVGILVWLMIGWRIWKRAASRALLPIAFLIGIGFGAFHGAYVWIRLEQITLNEKPVVFDPRSLVGTFVLLAGAAFWYLNARSRRGRVVAMLLALFPLLAGAVIITGIMFGTNFLAAQQLGAGYFNYSLTQMSLLAAMFEAVLFAAAFELPRRLYKHETQRGS